MNVQPQASESTPSDVNPGTRRFTAPVRLPFILFPSRQREAYPTDRVEAGGSADVLGLVVDALSGERKRVGCNEGVDALARARAPRGERISYGPRRAPGESVMEV
jgi:hypothetical protein